MDKKYIILGGALVIGAAVAYYISSRQQPQEDFYASSASGGGSGNIVLPPAPVSNTYNTTYDLKFPEVPAADLSGLGGGNNAKPDYTSKSSGSGGGSSGPSDIMTGQSFDPSIGKQTAPAKQIYSQPIGPGLPGSPGPSSSTPAYVPTRQSFISGAGKVYNAVASTSPLLPSISTYNRVAAAVPGIPTTSFLKKIFGW